MSKAECARLIWSQIDNSRVIDDALRNVCEYRIDPQNAARENRK